MSSVSVFSLSDPKAETRLFVTVNGFEFHVYNRTDLYARLQETFGLEPTLLSARRDEERGPEPQNHAQNHALDRSGPANLSIG